MECWETEGVLNGIDASNGVVVASAGIHDFIPEGVATPQIRGPPQRVDLTLMAGRLELLLRRVRHGIYIVTPGLCPPALGKTPKYESWRAINASLEAWQDIERSLARRLGWGVVDGDALYRAMCHRSSDTVHFFYGPPQLVELLIRAIASSVRRRR
jgi:hypothetical protein